MQGTGRIHLGGPQIVKAAINEVVDGETLGGAAMHTRVSGVTDYLAGDERQALAKLRQIVRHLNLPPSQQTTAGESRAPRFNAGEIERNAASAEVNEVLQQNMRLAASLGINGTPGYVVGDSVIPGAVGAAALKARILALKEP